MLPVAVTEETFRHNGIISAQDAQELPVAKLREIFGADAALYLDVRHRGWDRSRNRPPPASA